jgi:hypothetical protein
MADDEPRTGELTTANYGWIKPTVGDSDDAWGGYLNSDLDGIDSVVHGIQASIPTVPAASATAPAMDGTASAGSSAAWSRGDHVHPSDTTKYNTSNPSGYQTAAQVTVSLASYLALSGGTMTGAMTLAADPAANLQPATKQYVDAVRVGDNRIINGNFALNQRGYVSGTALPASPTVANGYGHDRWKAGAGGCTYTFTVAVPDTTITITANTLTQIIEAGMIEGGVFTLSWTGTAQARVWQGTPAGSYAASPVTTAVLTTGTNTVVEFNAGTLTRVKLEVGSVATPFNRQSLAKSMADCQRYYQVGNAYHVLYNAVSGALFGHDVPLLVFMRATPTITFVGPTYVNAGGVSTNSISAANITAFATGTAVGTSSFTAPFNLTAEL